MTFEEITNDPVRIIAFILLLTIIYAFVTVVIPVFIFSNSDVDPSTPCRLGKTTKLNVVGIIFAYTALFIIFLPYMAGYGIYRAFTWHPEKEKK